MNVLCPPSSSSGEKEGGGQSTGPRRGLAALLMGRGLPVRVRQKKHFTPTQGSPVWTSVAPEGPKQGQHAELVLSVPPGLALQGFTLSWGRHSEGLWPWCGGELTNGPCFSQHLLWILVLMENNIQVVAREKANRTVKEDTGATGRESRKREMEKRRHGYSYWCQQCQDYWDFNNPIKLRMEENLYGHPWGWTTHPQTNRNNKNTHKVTQKY